MTHATFPPPAPPQPKRHTGRNILLLGAAVIAALAIMAPDDEQATDDRTPTPAPVQILDVVWADLTISERVELCDGYELLGTEAAYQAFISGMDTASVNRNDFHAFFDRKCS